MTTIDELQRLIALIDEKTKGWPELPDWKADTNFEQRDEQRRAYHAYSDRILAELAETEGAKYDGSRPWEGGALKMAGIRTTCTGGSHGLLSNWQAAARRRIAKLQAEEGARA